jgi:hypothetical protein
MLMQSPRAPCVAASGPGSIWNYLGAPVRSAGVSGRFACGFRTDLHFADVPHNPSILPTLRPGLFRLPGECLGVLRLHNRCGPEIPRTCNMANDCHA